MGTQSQEADGASGTKTDSNQLQIEYVRLNKLRAPKKQLRKHPKAQIEALKQQMREEGFIGFLVISEQDQIIDGVARFRAAKDLGYEDLPCARLKIKNDIHADKIAIALNKIPEAASWDTAGLQDALRSIELEGIYDIGSLGFDTPELDQFLSGAALPSDDTLPAIDETNPPTSRVGDGWTVREHRVAVGDARSPETFEFVLKARLIVMAIIDPPWGVRVAGHIRRATTKQREFLMGGADFGPGDYRKFASAYLKAIVQNAADGALIYVFSDARHLEDTLTAAREIGLQLITICTWAKENFGLSSFYRTQTEQVCVLKKGTAPHINNMKQGHRGKTRTTVWKYAGINQFGASRDELATLHPTPKPVEMIKDAILDASKRDSVVLDSFLGSGTTLIAAELAGRRGCFIELDPRYVDVALKRFEERFGVEATLERTGETFSEVAERRANAARLSGRIRTRSTPSAGANNDRGTPS
jgi:DNA modification methylase